MTHPDGAPAFFAMPRPPSALSLPALPDWARDISRRREALGLSKTDLARAANVGRATIWECERGAARVRERTRERITDTLEQLEAQDR